MSFKPALLNFQFENFSDLPSEIDSKVLSGIKTDCNGKKWRLKLCPGGLSRASKKGWIALFLRNENKEPIQTKYSFAVKNAEGFIICESSLNGWLEFKPKGSGRGNLTLVERSKILDPAQNILKDDSFCIDVTIQIKESKENIYHPPNELSDKMLTLLETGNQTDVAFKVGRRKLHAHSVILVNNAPFFTSYIDLRKQKTEIKIENTKPEVFEIILKHIYAGFVPGIDDVLKKGRDLIDAANRYELVNLKMAIENIIVQERILNKSNVSEYIVFADAQSCPLLKEYAISYFLLHAKEVLKSEHSKCLRESSELLSEMLVLVAGVNEGEESMTVTELRKELGKRDLDADGSKEALVSRLREAKRQKTD